MVCDLVGEDAGRDLQLKLRVEESPVIPVPLGLLVLLVLAVQVLLVAPVIVVQLGVLLLQIL